MSGANAINLGYNPSFGADQYWQQYLQWAQALDKQSATNAAIQNGQNTQGTTTNTVFKGGNSTQASQKKESHTGRNLLIFGASAAAIIAGVALKKGCGDKTIKEVFQSKEVWSTMKTGFSSMFSSVKSGAKNIFTTKNSNISKEFTVGTDYCTVPEKFNRGGLDKTAASVADEAKNVGAKITEFVAESVPKGAEVKSYTMTVDGCEVFVRNGKLTSIKNNAGESIKNSLSKSTEQKDIDLLKTIQEKIADVAKGETQGLPYSVQSYKYTENGVTSLFRRSGTDPNKFELSTFLSNKFTKNSDKVLAYAEKHPEAKALLEKISKGETKDLKILTAELESSGLGTFKIENGKVSGLWQADASGKKIFYPCNDDHFLAEQNRHPEVFENVLKNIEKYTNVVYGV